MKTDSNSAAVSDAETDKGRLRWRCRRGMRELDQAMLAWLDNEYDNASDQDRRDFAKLLEWQEPELYRLVCGKDKDARYQHIIDQIGRTLVDQAHALKDV